MNTNRTAPSSLPFCPTPHARIASAPSSSGVVPSGTRGEIQASTCVEVCRSNSASFRSRLARPGGSTPEPSDTYRSGGGGTGTPPASATSGPATATASAKRRSDRERSTAGIPDDSGCGPRGVAGRTRPAPAPGPAAAYPPDTFTRM